MDDDTYYIEPEENIKWVRNTNHKIVGCWYEGTYCNMLDIGQNVYLHERYHFRIKDDAEKRK